MKLPVVFVLLAAGLEAAVAVDKYFEIGGKLSLKPESLPAITAISWKHEGNFVAEWIKDTVPLTYFGAFEGRTDLNTITGELTIKSMTKADEGLFTLEVNNEAQAVGYSAKGITHLRDRKVEVVQRPLTCGTNSDNCTLSCLGPDADADVGPVQYSWQQDEGPWEELQEENKIIYNDEETQRIKTFSCKMKNPISEKGSEPLENPFIKKSEAQGGLVFGIIVLVLLVLGGVALSVFAHKQPQKIAPCLRCVTGHPDQHDAENPPGDGTKGEELQPLRSKTDNGTSIESPPPYPDETLKDPETVTSNGDHDPNKS